MSQQSFHQQTANGSNIPFTITTFSSDEIKVYVDGVESTNGGSSQNDYTIPNYTTTGGTVTWNTTGSLTAPASPSVIRIIRQTDVMNNGNTAVEGRATYSAGSSVKADDLNNNQKQVLRALKEEQDQLIQTYDIEDGSVTSAKIKDGTIVNADISASAAIDGSKLQTSSGSVAGSMSSANFTKLAGIETAATADQTASEIRTLVESASDSNVFTDADHTKLNNIETAATADQTNAEIRTAVENATDSNVFTDADHTKLNSLGTLSALSDVNLAGVANDKILKYDSTSSKFIIADDGGGGGGGGSSTFTGLSDTPANFGSAAGKTLKVNSAGDAVEFVTVSAATSDVVDDTSPQLGGHLDTNGYGIISNVTNGSVQITPNGTGNVKISGAGGNDGTLQLNCSANTHGVKIKSPAHSAAANYTLTLPTALGSAGYALISDALGQLSFGPVISSQDAIISLYDQSGTPVQRLLATTEGVQVQGTSGGVSKLMFRDRTTANKLKFKPVDTLAADVEFTLPSADGSNGQYLKTNGSGVLSFADVSSTYNISINTLSSSSGSGGGSATFNGSATRFTLSNAGTNAQAHIVSVNGVIQKPNSGTSPSEGFAIDGNDIIFASAPASGSDFFILTLGNAVSIGTPSDNTVNANKLTTDAVTNVKILDDTISEAKLDIHAAPSGTDKVLGYTANGMEWVVAAAGATGGGTDKIFYENGQTVTTNYTITNNTNAMSAGPVTINNGVAVTIGTGENWTIV